MNHTEQTLRQTVKGLFDSGRIDLLLGYERGTLPLRTRPAIIGRSFDAGRLVWNGLCSNHLAVYLPGLLERKPPRKRGEPPPPLPRVGMVAKGCDLRSAVGLVKEKQAPRQNLVLIGVPCLGMLDVAKVRSALDGDSPAEWADEPGGSVVITTSGGRTQSFEREQLLQEACLECDHASPDGADLRIEGPSRSPSEKRFSRVGEFETEPPAQRWQHFLREISRCIRCYACRQACPNCYCRECFAEQTKPRWIGVSTELTDVVLYHIGRIFHQAGRCVSCDACVRACPMGIDLRPFTQKVVKDVEELFGYVPGMSPEEVPPLCAFREDDTEEFITEP